MESRNLLFRCPRTGLMVGARLDDPPADATESGIYAGTHCNACGGWHLVNCKTGKLLSEEDQRRR
jgi:hypothetical protein